MAAHRYWRLLLPPQVIGNGVQLSEVQLRGTVGGANIAGSATRSSPFGTIPEFFDGNNATEFYAFAGGDHAKSLWIAFDFGAATTVAEVYLRTGSNGALAPLRLQVQFSDDGVAWRFMGPPFDTASLGATTVAAFSGLVELTPGARMAAGSLRLAVPHLGGNPSARVPGLAVRHDFYDGGLYRVAGTVAIDGTPITPVRRRVRLFHRITGRLVRETWSDAAGNFAFERIALAEYLVVSDDYTRTYNAVVADAVTAVA